MSATATIYAHMIAGMAGCEVEALVGLNVTELDVLYYGLLSDGASEATRSTIRHMDTGALEYYSGREGLSMVDRAACRYELARRAVATCS